MLAKEKGNTEPRRMQRPLGQDTVQDADSIDLNHSQQALVDPVAFLRFTGVINKFLGKGAKEWGTSTFHAMNTRGFDGCRM